MRPAAISGLRMAAARVGTLLGKIPQPIGRRTANRRMITRWTPGSVLVGIHEEQQSIPHRVHATIMNHQLAH